MNTKCQVDFDCLRQVYMLDYVEEDKGMKVDDNSSNHK
jgi:hypothetical protein